MTNLHFTVISYGGEKEICGNIKENIQKSSEVAPLDCTVRENKHKCG